MMPFRSSRPAPSWLLTSTICLLLALVPGLASATQASDDASAPEDPAPQRGTQQAGDGVARPWSLGVRGLGVLPAEDSLDNGFGFGGFAVYRVSTDVEVEIDASWVRLSSSPEGLGDGDLTLMPIRGTARIQLWRFRGAEPYAGGGAGIYLADFSLDDSVVSRFDQLGFTVAQDVETGVGVHAAAGVEWSRDRYSFGVDARYVVGSLDGSSRVIDQVSNLVFTESDDIDLNGFWISFGVRVRL